MGEIYDELDEVSEVDYLEVSEVGDEDCEFDEDCWMRIVNFKKLKRMLMMMMMMIISWIRLVRWES